MNIGRTILIVLVALAIVVTAVVLIDRARGPVREEAPPEVQVVPEETRTVTLYFPDRQAESLTAEAREIAVRDGFENQVKAVVHALADGPVSDDAVGALPPETAIVQVFWVEERQTLFLDFNAALVSDHPGGSTGEYFTIAMLLRTISENFPAVRRVQILVEGSPVETIAGHYAVDEPLDVMTWR